MKKNLVCPFCGRSQASVVQMFVMRDGVICSDCVEIAYARWQKIQEEWKQKEEQALALLMTPEELNLRQVEKIIGKEIRIIDDRDGHLSDRNDRNSEDDVWRRK